MTENGGKATGIGARRRKRQQPMYQVLKADLEQAIRSGQLKPGALVPSESELIARYQVSSTTARRCLDELESDGLLERKRGKGTFVSALASMLNKRRIAIVVNNYFSLAHPFLATVVGILEHTLEKAGLHVVIVRATVNAGEGAGAGTRLLEMIEHEGADHVFLLSNMPLALVTPLLDRGVCCLGVNTRYLDPRVPYIASDYASAFSLSLRELLERGHRQICNVVQEAPMAQQGVMNSSSILQQTYLEIRQQGYDDLPAEPLVTQVEGVASLAEAIPAVLKENPGITAFRCWDELAGLEIMRILSSLGRRVPEEFSIVGVRLLPVSPLTCVENPINEVAAKAAQAMLEWIGGCKPESVLITSQHFLKRETIAPVR